MTEKYEITTNNGELVVNETVLALFDRARTLKATIDELKKQLDEIEKPLKKAMAKGKVKKYEGESLTAVSIDNSFTETVNTERMKADGIYEKYKMLVPKSGSVRIYYAKEKNNG
jgi:regulator of replication initiation timing